MSDDKESTSESIDASVPDATNCNPAEPYSVFTTWQKRHIVCIIALAAWFSTLSSFIYYPATALIAKDLGISITDVNLSITTYMVCSAVAPSITGDASDIFGRRPLYLLTLSLYFAANIGLALESSLVGLLLLRMLQSAGISGAFSIAYAVVADISAPSERGSYVGALSFAITTAPSIGPLIGGALSHSKGWRWIFWLLSIFSGVCLMLLVFFFPETARGVVGNGSLRPPRYSVRPSTQCLIHRHGEKNFPGEAIERQRSFPNPLKCLSLLLAKDTAAVVFAGAFLYTTFCVIPASLGTLFIRIYGLNQLQAGLVYLPFGIGCTVAAIASSKLIDRDYRITAESLGLPIDRVRGDDLLVFPIEKARLRSVFAPLLAAVASVVSLGWALEKRAPLAIPLVLQFISGLSIQTCFNATNTLRVDINPAAPAAAQASSNFVRCILAAISVAFLQTMLDHSGIGWTYTFFGFVCSLSGILFLIERKKGMGWRQKRLTKPTPVL